jgi:uncharacterized protein (TIGR02118 family)
MFYMVGAFDLRLSGATVADAERHYLERHVPLARRLPGLRAYVIGTLAATQGIPADRRRGAILAFDSEAAWRDAYRSPVGRELRDDEKRLIADPRVLLLRGEEIVPGLGGLAG